MTTDWRQWTERKFADAVGELLILLVLAMLTVAPECMHMISHICEVKCPTNVQQGVSTSRSDEQLVQD